MQEKTVVLQGEKDALQEQLRIEKAGNRGLETLLASERKKVDRWLNGSNSYPRLQEYHSQLSGQEKEVELQHLKEQVERLDATQTSYKQQLRSEQVQSQQKSIELEQLRTELASEKFKR